MRRRHSVGALADIARRIEWVAGNLDDIDSLVSKFEDFVVDEYKSGGVTKQAKDHLDQMLRTVNRRRKKPSSEPPAQ